MNITNGKLTIQPTAAVYAEAIRRDPSLLKNPRFRPYIPEDVQIELVRQNKEGIKWIMKPTDKVKKLHRALWEL